MDGGFQPQYPVSSTVKGCRQEIVNMEFIIDTTPPGKLTLASLLDFMTVLNNTITVLRQSRNQLGGNKGDVLVYLRNSRDNLQLAMDESHSRSGVKRYNYIRLVQAELEKAIDNWSTS